MIEINTIQDIRQIENKLIGGFTGKQLITIIIVIIVNIPLFLNTHSLFLMLIVSLIILAIGFFKKGNLTAIQYAKLFWDKQQQPRVRTYKNKNIIAQIERQCKTYKPSKKKGADSHKE